MISSRNNWRKRWGKNPIIRIFTNLKLTVSLLACSMALVFFGTLDQVNIGINKALKVYFESFFVVWRYPEEWPMGTRMVLVTNAENEIAKKHKKIAVDDPALKDFRFMGFVDNTFHSQIEAVFEDTDGMLKPDSELRFHTVDDIKAALAKEKFKNDYGAILPHTALLPSKPELARNSLLDNNQTGKKQEPKLTSIDLEGQPPFTLNGFPVPMPGGYLLGGLLLVNLLTSALFRYPLTFRYTGIWTLHSGVALMLIGELVTDLTETHSSMPIIEQESANFSSDFHLDELVVINESDPLTDHVLSIPAARLDPLPDDLGSRIKRFFSDEKPSLAVINLQDTNENFPFILRVKKFYKNGGVKDPETRVNGIIIENGGAGYSAGDPLMISGGSPAAEATAQVTTVDASGAITSVTITSPGSGYRSVPSIRGMTGSISATLTASLRSEKSYEIRNRRGMIDQVVPEDDPETFKASTRNFRGALVEIAPLENRDKPIGKWFVSSLLNLFGYLPHVFEYKDKSYRLEMRQKRYYYPFEVELLDFRFLRYPGTSKAKDFSSDVNLLLPNEPARPTRIYMNHPLHLNEYVFYQRSFDPENDRRTVLEVVHNPGSLIPYVGVSLVGLGLIFQFCFHLFGFARRREKKVQP